MKVNKQEVMKLNIRKLQNGDKISTFSLPEINIYPNNKWGDIARKQGLQTARNWRKVKEGTTAGINQFANDPRTQFVTAILPIPQGIEAVSNLKKAEPIRSFLVTNKLNKSIEKTKLSPKLPPLNMGWAPAQKISVIHDTTSNRLPKLFFEDRWDVVNEGANPFGIWFQGKWGIPRMTHYKPGKVEKAAKARALFADRPYRLSGTLKLDKPIQTVGDVPNRAYITKMGEKTGSDGIIFNNVYDNGYGNNQVIFSFKDLTDGVITKKGGR